MFHVLFLNDVAQVGKLSMTEAAERYDSRFGRPMPDLQEKLQKAVFEIQKINDYKGFFHYVGLPVPSQRFLHDLLNQSVENSLKKKYHRDPNRMTFHERQKEAEKKIRRAGRDRESAEINKDIYAKYQSYDKY